MKGELPNGYITPCQLAVWRLVARGRVSKEIAQELGVSPKTIDHHRTELCRKLGAHNLADLTRKAVEHAVIEVPRAPLQTVRLGRREYHLIPGPAIP